MSQTRVCVVYIVHHSGGLSQLMGIARKRTHTQALQTSRKKAKKTHVLNTSKENTDVYCNDAIIEYIPRGAQLHV